MPPATRCSIIPPYLLLRLLANADPVVAERAANTLEQDVVFRSQRRDAPAAAAAPGLLVAGAAPQRRVHDARGSSRLPGSLVRSEGDDPAADVAVNEVYDGFGATWQLWFAEYGRNSLDGAGMALIGTVHYQQHYDNAFWDGSQMVFGDGDGEIFGRFTASLDVISHELAHAVTQHTANLDYYGQPGALNEHISDVFGVLAKQRLLGQDAAEADWLIGAELLLPGVAGRALRDLLNPGTAYDDPRLGKDPQPAHVDGYIETTDDHGGVHLNSGIPNRAFALAARAIGGPAWARAGRVWFDVLTGPDMSPSTDFASFAQLTRAAAIARFGEGSPEATAVAQGWDAVGLGATGSPADGQPSTKGQPPLDPTPPPSDVDLLVRRTGGFAGLVAERQTTLADLPARDADAWAVLLNTGLRARPEGEGALRDAYWYRVCSSCHGVDVSLAEDQLTKAEQSLFDRTLRG